MSTHRWIALAAFLLAIPALLPLAGANNGDGGNQCVMLITSANASGVHPIVDLGDQIAVGLSSGVGVPFGAVLVIIPALCNVPSPWDAIGSVEHTQSNSSLGPSDLVP